MSATVMEELNLTNLPKTNLPFGLPRNTAAVASEATIGCADPKDTGAEQEGQTASASICSSGHAPVTSLHCQTYSPRGTAFCECGHIRDRHFDGGRAACEECRCKAFHLHPDEGPNALKETPDGS